MQIKSFTPGFLSLSVLSGIVGGVLLIFFYAMTRVYPGIKAYYSFLIWAFAMLTALKLYKNKNLNAAYLKLFLTAFIVYSIMTLLAFVYLLLFFPPEKTMHVHAAVMILFRLFAVGAASSLTAALFFTKKRIHKVIAVALIIAATVGILFYKMFIDLFLEKVFPL